ncbi:hypothetical protein NQ318_013106 [Aromia moschata]|uniref:Uncharacterized protein n=1 Tax=Aromia moschata TaxID=1265417 RepID=A0AAV8Y265_9CUCU|nr:hypothetical protein NQ318_013106 [Aromia moschata]
MHRTRRATKRTPIIEQSSDSEDEVPLKRLHKSLAKVSDTGKKLNIANTSSSESDIENYLQPIDKIDLTSSFFNVQKKHERDFNKIEKDIFAGGTRLSDSDSDQSIEETDTQFKNDKQDTNIDLKDLPSTSTSEPKLNFHQLEEYTKKIEEAKKHVEEYNARRKAEEHKIDISNLLAAGESKNLTLENIKPEDLHSSDFESCDSDQEDWEEVRIKDSQEPKEKSLIPKDGVQITVDMPDTCRKKKGIDLLAAMKRRLNRIRKENQIYVHKVHLLCWIAHGNYVNQSISDTETLGLALSLLPSDKCYPSERTDLGYLEQIVQWYKRTIKLLERPAPKNCDLVNALQLQINKKEACNKKMLAYIFVAILRALGIQCRLVFSFQVEPLRPPASELHSLAKEPTPKKDSKTEHKDKAKPENKNKVPSGKEKSLGNKAGAKVKGENKRSRSQGQSSQNEKKTSTSKDKDLQNNTGAKIEDKKKKTHVKDENKNLDNTVKDVDKKHAKKSNKSESNKTETRTSARKIDNNNEKQTRSKCKKTEKEDDSKEDKGGSKKGSTRKDFETNEKKIEVKDSKGTRRTNLTVERDKNVRSKSTENVSKGAPQKNADRLAVKEVKKRSKSSGDANEQKPAKAAPATKKSILKIKLPKKEKPKQVPQLDGIYNSSDEDSFAGTSNYIPQLDGADDDKKNVPKSSKPNLKKLSAAEMSKCDKKKHPLRFKSRKTEEDNSENEFRPRSPFTRKNVDSPRLSTRGASLEKLKSVKQVDVKNDIINLIKGRIVEQKHVDRSRTVQKRKPRYESESDSDYMPEPIKKKHHDSDSDLDYFVPRPKVKQRISFRNVKMDKKNLSGDSDADKSGNKKKKGVDVWAEVFLENEEKWISVDVVHGQVHCVNELFTRATHPVSYIVAWNNDNFLKDVTMRYCKNFNTVTRKLRVDAKWWGESLMPFQGPRTARDKEEDDDLNRQQLDQPLPKSIAEYKNHPLSRDIWVKEARVVKPGEKPYKIVKARPKYDKLSNQIITDQLLEIFGIWQTTEYEPPTAENGVVPRNAFGNVELFKACMLPKRTVHLKLPGLNKICKRMDIDCAPAIEQDEIEKRENEKIEKRVYGNWRKLIKGLLIRERLKAKYNFGSTSGEGGKDKKKPKGPRFCTKKRRICSDSESESDNT